MILLSLKMGRNREKKQKMKIKEYALSVLENRDTKRARKQA
jgi:hypothetical protein